MEPILTTLLLLLVSHSISSVPVEWTSSQCSSTCQSDPQFVRFDPQKTYEYRLQTKTHLNSNQEFLVSAVVEVSAHSPCDLSLQLRQTRVQGFDIQESLQLAQQLEAEPIQFGYDDGVVTDVCASQEDHQWAIDVKKAVISALQMSSRSLSQRTTLMESDIVGDCETTYEPMSRHYAKYVLRKTKSLNRCANRQLAQIGLFPRAFAASYQAFPLMNASFECLQTVDKDLISGATCQETQQLRGYGTQVSSFLNLRFDKQTSGLSSGRVRQFMANSGHLRMSSRFDSQKQDFNQILRSVCQNLESDSHERTVESFPELVIAVQNQKSEEMQRMWKQIDSREMCASKQMSDLFLDASALSGSEGGAQVLRDVYESKHISHARANYLFSLLAFTSSPTQKAVQILQPLLQKTETPKHVILGISGLIHNLRQQKSAETESQRAVDSLLQRMSSLRSDSSLVATIKAIQNIGVNAHQRARQQLMKVAQDSRQSSGVRSAAIKALSEAMDSQQKQQMLELFGREGEKNEIRINAYKAVVMSGIDKNLLNQIREQIRKEQNRDIRQFVRSHQKNLKESSDPHKKYVLPANAPQFDEPENQWVGVSNNFESSFMFDALSLGVAWEADVIHAKDSSVPRSMTANFTVPAFGSELQLFEVEIRQKGFENVIQQKLRQFKSHQNLFKQLFAEFVDLIASADQWANQVDSGDLQLQIYVKVDGKTILSLDASDAKADWWHLWQTFRQHLDERLDFDRAFAVQPINTRIQLPSSSGIPVFIRVNATLVSSVSASVKVSDLSRNSNSKVFDTSFVPKFALQIESAVEFAAKSQKKAVEVVSRVTSSPVWDSKFEIRENRIVSFKINLPKERQTLIRAETQVYERDVSGVRRVAHKYSNGSQKTCSQTFKEAFGLQFCAEFSSQPLAYELTIEKSDRSMKGYDFSVESPHKESKEPKNYRIAFNTPNSETDRQLSAELQIQSPQSGRQSAKVQIRSPWIRYSVEAGFRNEDKEQSIQLEMQRDGKKAFSLDLGLESQQRGQKREYRPRVRIQMSPQSEVIQMQGSVSVSKGRKNQLQIQLEGNQKQFLKGSFVREGERKSNDFRISSDISANLPALELRVTGVAEKGVKHAETDLTVEYRLKQERKHSLKVTLKVQNLTQSQLTKVSAFGELTSTQFPQMNFHLAYNLLAKPEQQVENELTLAWTQQLSSKIHVLQVTKISDQSANQRKLENTLNVEVTPLGINYELRANAQVTKADSASGPQYSAEVVGKDRTGSKDNDLKAHFQYKHVQKSPLHLTLEMNLKTHKRDFQYRDELRERDSGEYSGKTSVQWAKDQKADLDYNYKTKGYLHHEMDAQLKTDKHMMKHSAVLKMSNKEFQLKSKLSANDKHIYSVDSYLSRENPSQIEAQTLGYAFKASAQPHQIPQLASVELWTPSARIAPFHHKTNVEFIPKTSFALKSDTKRNNRQILTVDSHVSRNEPSRLVINSEPIEGRFDLDLISDRRSAALDLKSQTQDWTHSSSFALEPQHYELKSKTVSLGKPVLNIESNWKPRSGQNSYLSVEYPPQKSALSVSLDPKKSANIELLVHDLKHKTDFDLNPKNWKISSKTDRNRRQIHSLDYHYNNGLHSLDSELFQNYKISGEALPYGEEPYLEVRGQHKDSQFETKSKLSKQSDKIVFETKSKQKGNSLNEISAQFSPNVFQKHQISYNSPQIRALVSASPVSDARLEWESPQVSHVSSVNWKDSDYWLDSKTNLKPRNQFWNFGAKHNLQMSRLSAHAPIGQFDFELTNQQRAKLALLSKHRNYPFSHVSEVSANQDAWNFDSRTDSQSANVFALQSQISRQNSPSTLALQVGRDFSAKARAQPFGQKRHLAWEAKHPNWSHVTAVDVDDRELSLKSRTDDKNNRNVNKIDAFLTPRDLRSHVSFVSQNSNANLEFEPQKSARLEFNAQPYSHKTEVETNGRNGIVFRSKTARNGSPLLDVNSAINEWTEGSHLNINSPLIESRVSGIPSQKWAKIQFKTQSVDHNSHLNLPQRSFTSNTEVNGQTWAKVNAQFNNEQQLELEIPHFVAKSGLNLDQRSAFVDYKWKLPKGRHVLASVLFKEGFHSDIAWDLDKEPNQRLVVDVSAHREGSDWGKKQLVFALSATYAGNEAKVTSRMTTSQPWRGPHEWQLSYVPKYYPKRDSLFVEFKHEIKDQEMQCFVHYSEGQKELKKFGAKLNARLESGDESGVSVSVETVAPHNPDLEVKLAFNERHSSLKRRNAEIFAELKALKTSLNQQFLISANIKSSDGQLRGNGRLETPQTSGPQNLEFVLNKRQLKVWTSNQSSKQLELNAHYESKNSGFESEVELKSNIRGIPSVSAVGVLDYNQISLTVDADQQRKVDFALIKAGNSYSSGVSLEGRLETSFWPKIETKNSLKYNSKEMEFQSNFKFDYKEISSVEFSARKDSNVWSGSARIAANGAELAKASLESSFGSNAMNYILSAHTSDWSPIKVTFLWQKISSSEIRLQMNACSQQKHCFDVKTQWKNGDHVIPEKAVFSVTKMGTNVEIKTSFMEEMPSEESLNSLLSVSQERPQKKIRNQFQISINSHALGFDSIHTQRNHGYDTSLQLHFPSNRVIQIKTDFSDRKSGQTRDVISKSQLIVDGKQPLIETSVRIESDSERVSTHIQLSSEKFRRSPKTLSFEIQRPQNQKPFVVKAFVDLADDPNDALTIESSVIQRSMNSNSWTPQKNTTLHLALSTRDRRSLDFQLSAHLSPISAGVHYQNVNRRGHPKSGSLLIRQTNENSNDRRFEAFFKTDENDYKIDASVVSNAVSLKVFDQKTGQQNDVRLVVDDKCLRFESKTGEQKRLDFCANFDQRNDKFLTLTLETDHKKSLELSLELDSRDQKALKASANWSPEWLKAWQQRQQSSNQKLWISEIWRDLEHKSEVVAKQLQTDAFYPFYSLFSDEFSDVIQEFYRSFQPIQVFLQSVTSSVQNSAHWLNSNAVDQWQRVVRSARKQCKRSEICFKAIYALENYGLESWLELGADYVIEGLKRTHRLVMTSSGRFQQSLPSIPDWLQSIADDYRQSVYATIEVIVDSNPELRQVANHVIAIFSEVAKSADQIDWSSVKRALGEIWEMIASSESTSSRVIVWDPLRGKASLEIRSPAVQSRRLRAVLQNASEEIRSKDSIIESMF